MPPSKAEEQGKLDPRPPVYVTTRAEQRAQQQNGNVAQQAAISVEGVVIPTLPEEK